MPLLSGVAALYVSCFHNCALCLRLRIMRIRVRIVL